MLSPIATEIISPAKRYIIGAIYSFTSLHGNERYIGQPFLIRSVRAKLLFQKIFRLLRLSIGFDKSIRTPPALMRRRSSLKPCRILEMTYEFKV